MMFQSENKVKNLCALEVAESGAVTMFIRNGDKNGATKSSKNVSFL